MRKPWLALLCCLPCMLTAQAGIVVGHDGIDLSRATIVCDNNEKTVVRTAAQLLADDVQRVCGTRPNVSNKAKRGMSVVVGTIGQGGVIDKVGKKAGIEGQWERFVITTTGNQIVVAGSDARGTAYGCMAISEAIGVNPWYWWADIAVEHRDAVVVKADTIAPSPKVKFRGIFINDEDWGLKTWSERNYEKDLRDIGPKTYEKVCELLLRLKGNMLAPAMHSCTGAFYSHKESKVAADKYGIMITTSHCEPLLFNNAAKSEWDKSRDGEWDFSTNRATILRKLDDRVREASPYENIYTVGMRGLHDEGMRGNLTPDERVRVLQEAITEERNILTRYGVGNAPQIFVPYKEALDNYERGLQVPDDVTLVWPDDNYGYMKRLSNAAEQQRGGRAGVYYHLSYLGTPHDYLWLCTTPPALMYEELRKAFDAGADRYWLLNVGDIKPMELAMQTFFEMAADPDRYTLYNINRQQSAWLRALYGVDCQSLLDDYYRLAWSRKPEFMGWEIEWDAKEYADIRDTEFSFANYNDAQQRLADYDRISSQAAQMMAALPEAKRASFFEMVAYPVMAACQMNRKFLMAQLNHELSAQGKRAEANWAADEAQAAYDSIEALNLRYNTHMGGKWNEMMHLPTGYCARYQNMPRLTRHEGAGCTSIDLAPQPYSLERCMVLPLTSPTQNNGCNVVEGIGYDWKALQLNTGSTATYTLPAIDADSVTVTLYSLPFFPTNKTLSTRYGVSVDGNTMHTCEYRPVEWSYEWKVNVLRNSAVFTARFAIDRQATQHTLTLTGIDPAQMVQRVVLDWGGLKPTYVGPALTWAARQ